MLEGLGCEDLRTYIQSGNAVFRREIGNRVEFESRIAGAIESNKGFALRVLLLTADEFAAAVDNNPFPGAGSAPKSLHLSFLAAEPDDVDVDGLQELRADKEGYRLISRVFYFYAPDGIGRSKLAAKIEGLLGVPATARNFRTVTKILELAEALSSRC